MKRVLFVSFVIASLILNVVFISSWVVHTIGRGQSTRALPHCAFNATTPHPLYRSLGITNGQWQSMQPAITRFSDSSRYLNDSINAYRATIIELLAKDSVDMASITNVQSSILHMQQRLQMLVIDQIVSEKNVLTPKQRQDLFLLLRSSCSHAREGLLSDSTSGMRYNCLMNSSDR
jgi:Spy/CpxP family protein refolding chaperone